MTTNPTAKLDERCGRRAADLCDEHDRALLLGDSPALDWIRRAAPALVRANGVADATICFVAANAVGPDGSVTAPGVTDILPAARQARLPIYVLAPAGPVDRLPPGDAIPASQINAIVTSRGIYRPDRVTRHHEDGDAPFDVIPLR